MACAEPCGLRAFFCPSPPRPLSWGQRGGLPVCHGISARRVSRLPSSRQRLHRQSRPPSPPVSRAASSGPTVPGLEGLREGGGAPGGFCSPHTPQTWPSEQGVSYFLKLWTLPPAFGEAAALPRGVCREPVFTVAFFLPRLWFHI